MSLTSLMFAVMNAGPNNGKVEPIGPGGMTPGANGNNPLTDASHMIREFFTNGLGLAPGMEEFGLNFGLDQMKLQFGCLIILLFIAALYYPVKRNNTKSHKVYCCALGVAIFNVIFDGITVYTVNHISVVGVGINRLCHLLFIGSLILELYLCFCYNMILIHENKQFEMPKHKATDRIAFLVMCIGFICLFFMPMTFVESTAGNYSFGTAVIGIYLLIIISLIFTQIHLIVDWKSIVPKKRSIILLANGVMMATTLYQSIFPWTLMTSLAITLINLAFFLTVESPDVHLIEQLEVERDRADAANAAKSEFLSNMSHEIRTPMNAIVGLTEVLLRKSWPEEETRYLQNMKSSGDALLTLINDLLDYSKIESGKFVITEDDYAPLDMLDDLRMIFQNRIGSKPIQMEYDIDKDLPVMLYGDGLRIRQVIINLVNNAIKFTESGTVTLAISVESKSSDKVDIKVSVKDSGIGIKEEDLPKLFQSFNQVDEKKNHGKEGSGLGLAICKQLVELMGGEIGVTSEYGKGSVFFFTLPQGVLSNETVGENADKMAVRKVAAVQTFDFTAPTAHVLVVDDNDINRAVAEALFAPLEMQVDTAVNGQEALERVQENAYDLVFMDHYMPIMDGIEATVAIRKLEDEKYRKLPIIALSADAMAGEREKFLAAGMNDFVSKPIRMGEICAVLRNYLPSDKLESMA